MFNAETGKQILDALFNTNKKTNNNYVSFGNTPWLALFTKMPDKNGLNYVEPSVSAGYVRVLLTNNGAYGKQIMASATTEDGTGDHVGKKIAVVKNQDLATFPEAREAAFGKIVGFGIFDENCVSSNGGVIANPAEKPAIFWGKLGTYDAEGNFTETTDGITVDQGEIPIFRIDDLKVYFV